MGEAMKALGRGPTVSIDGKQYELTPFNMDMVAMFEAWLEDRAWAKVERTKGTVPDDVYQERVQATASLINSGQLSYGSKAYSLAVESVPGKKYVIFLQLAAGNPGVTFDMVDKAFDSDMALLAAKLQAMSSGPKGEGEATPSP